MRAGYVRKTANKHEPLLDGSIVDENSLTLPWPLTVEVDPEEGLEMSDYYPGAKIMSKRLVETLRSTGVDNLQTFEAEIKNSETGEMIDDFVVVNVVGMVSCADEDASDASPLADVSFFHTLVIEPSRAKSFLMFRLSESRMDVIVHESVAKAIQLGNFTDVILEPLGEVTSE
jgi:hypothetical protein